MDLSFIENLKTTYPEEIAKDQFYRICHISKKTASFLLDTGIVPCRKTGKKTRQYKIYLDDVISFLEKREQNLLAWKVPKGYYKEKPKEIKETILLDYEGVNIRERLTELFSSYDDVLTVKEVATIVGHTTKTIYEWCLRGKIQSFLIHNKRKIPKEYLLDYLCSKSTYILQFYK